MSNADMARMGDSVPKDERIAKLVHSTTIALMCTQHGYAEAEVEAWIDENRHDFEADIASEYASVSSLLLDFAGLLLKEP